MSANNNLCLPKIPSRQEQGLREGVFCSLYVAGGTSPRDFFQPLGITGYKGGLSSRRDVAQRIQDLRARRYASVVAPLENRNATIHQHPLGCEWFLSPLPDPGEDAKAKALYEKLPNGRYENGVVTFRLPPHLKLPELEKKFQELLAPRALNGFLATPDGKQRLDAP